MERWPTFGGFIRRPISFLSPFLTSRFKFCGLGLVKILMPSYPGISRTTFKKVELSKAGGLTSRKQTHIQHTPKPKTKLNVHCVIKAIPTMGYTILKENELGKPVAILLFSGIAPLFSVLFFCFVTTNQFYHPFVVS